MPVGLHVSLEGERKKMAKTPRVSASLFFAGVLTLVSGCRFQITDGYVFDYKGETSQKTDSGTIDATVKSIEIKNKFGDVDVAHSTGESNWTWDGKSWATDKSDADEFVSQLEMNVVQDGDKQNWTIVLPDRNRKLRGVKSNLTIRIPSQVSVEVDNEHGKVSAHGLSGSTTINNEHGSIKATALTGETAIKNQHGQIVADNLSGAANLDCEHGDIKIDGSSESLSIQCEHGNVNVKNSSSDITTVTEHGKTTIESSGANVKCNAEHGDVKITLNNAEFQSIVADAEHSDVEISLPASAQPRVDLAVDHGKANSDFQSSENKNAPRIKVKTEHGDIRIREK